MSNREFDLVVFGATGFVGALTAEYLARAAPPNARIALAGRSLEKLTRVRDRLPGSAAKWPVLQADSFDEPALDALTARTRVVVTTVGPYLRYGLPLAQACARAGTHYADLTGEPPFVRDCIDTCEETAAASGAKIVNSCGYDSIPSDLSVYQLYRRSVVDGTGELTDTTLVASLRGGVSGGTLDTVRAMSETAADNPKILGTLANPYSLSPDRTRETDFGRQSPLTWHRADRVDPSLRGWLTTFVMAQHNTKIVRRSNGLLGWAYGKNFRYHEVMSAGSSRGAPLLAAAISGGTVAAITLVGALSRVSMGRRLLDRVLPPPGTGPTQDARHKGWFSMKTFTRTTSDAHYRCVFAGQGDPGYQATAVMLGQSGLCLAFDDLPPLGGVSTPAVAMGDALTERLRNAGMTIEVTATPNR